MFFVNSYRSILATWHSMTWVGTMARIPAPDPIDYLVRRKFPDLYGAMPKRYSEPPSRNLFASHSTSTGKGIDDSNFSPFGLLPSDLPALPEHQKLEEAADKYRDELSQKSAEEVRTLLQEEQRKEAAEKQAIAEEEERHRFFNLPSADADFDHYTKCARWTLDEGVALSFGKDPEQVHWKAIEPFVKVSPFARRYSKRRDLTQRAEIARQLCNPVSPEIFISWAKKLDIHLPDDLLRKAIDRGFSLKHWQDLYAQTVDQNKKQVAALLTEHKKIFGDAQKRILELEQQVSAAAPPPVAIQCDRTLGARERDNLQLIAFLGAVRGYEYDPDKRNSAARAIETDSEALGLRFTDDRIRAHLSAGAQLVPLNWRDRLKLKPNTGKR